MLGLPVLSTARRSRAIMVLPDDFCRLEKHLGQVTDILYCCEVCGIPRPALWVAAWCPFPESKCAHRELSKKSARIPRSAHRCAGLILISFILYIFPLRNLLRRRRLKRFAFGALKSDKSLRGWMRRRAHFLFLSKCFLLGDASFRELCFSPLRWIMRLTMKFLR